MTKCLAIGLKTDTVDDPTVVGLVSSDGQRFEANIAMLAPLRTVGHLLQEVVGVTDIHMPAVNGESLQVVMALLKKRLDFSMLDLFKDEVYFALTLACNYLEYQSALGYLLGGLVARFMALDDATFVAAIRRPFEDLLLAACVFLSKDQTVAFHRRFVSHFGTDTFSDTFQKPVRAFLASGFVSGFMWAAYSGRTAVVALLLATHGRDIGPSAYANWAIRYAAAEGRTAVLALLLAEPRERGIDPAAGGNEAIQVAAGSGHADVVAMLLAEPRERGIDPSARNNYAIRIAAANGHTPVVELLLSQGTGRGIDPSANNNEAIRYAAEIGHTDVVALLKEWERVRDAKHTITIRQPFEDLLLAACMFPPKDQTVAFHRRFVAHFGTDTFSYTFQKPVRAFLANGFVSGFMWAAYNGRTAVVALLLVTHGRDIGPSVFGNFAIRFATAEGRTAVVALLEQWEREHSVKHARATINGCADI